jgi:hypothetical protein
MDDIPAIVGEGLSAIAYIFHRSYFAIKKQPKLLFYCKVRTG